MHLLLIFAGLGWLCAWGLLAWLAWRADAHMPREAYDYWVGLPLVGLLVLAPAIGLILAGFGLIPGIAY